MLHLLGAVTLGWGVIIWAVLVTFGAITASVLGVAFASVALTGSAAWALWLLRTTQGRGHDEHEGHGPGSACACSSTRALDNPDRVDPEEHFHSN